MTPEDVFIRAYGAGAYSWPRNSCVSLITDLSLALGLSKPDYSRGIVLSEARAAALSIREHGSFMASHKYVLKETGDWYEVEGEMYDIFDVIFIPGRVLLRDMTVYEPNRSGREFTAVIGIDAAPWAYTNRGFSFVKEYDSIAGIMRPNIQQGG